MPAELTPEVLAFRLPDWAPVAALPGLGTLATDPYWKGFGEPAGLFVTRFSELVARLAADHGAGAQIGIQGYRLEPLTGR